MAHTDSSKPAPTCRLVRPAETYAGKQGLDYLTGLSAETVGSQGLCMHLLDIPPGARTKAHLHESHETAIYILSGVSEMWYGDGLEQHMVVAAGDLLYIPANVPHVAANPSRTEVCRAVIARTDPREQESVVLLPELDALVPPLSSSEGV